jgi:hypothetical protein
MNGNLTRDSAAVSSEIGRILGYSEVFFEAFRISSDRADQWQFLTFLLRKENNLRIQVRGLMKDKKFKKFLENSGLDTPDYVFRKLIAGFRNEDGKFLEVERSGKKDRALVLTDTFLNAARRYVELFFKKMSGTELPWSSTISSSVIVDSLKPLIGFQELHFWLSWLRFIKNIAAVKLATNFSQSEVRKEMRDHAPCWALLLTAWRYHIGDRKVSVDDSGLYRTVYDNMRGVKPRELEHCISFLTQEGGPKLLIPTKVEGNNLYLLNASKYEVQFNSYVIELIGHHQKMLREVRSIAIAGAHPINSIS